MKSVSEKESQKNILIILEKIFLSDKKSKEDALVIGLVGDLGSGKTFFVKNFLNALGVKERVLSPTFVLMREYKLSKRNKFNKKYNKAYHIDTYRLLKVDDLKSINLNKLIKEKNSIVLIEWADKIKKLLPKQTIWINFKHGKKENERTIKLDPRL